MTYVARKGYAVTELDYADLEEIYHLRALLERDAVERGLPLATDDDIDELEEAAAACRDAAVEGDVTTELAANRRFHFLLYGLAGSEQQLRLIRLLWDGTEAYRAIYYGTPGGEDEADRAHRAIVDAARARDVPALHRRAAARTASARSRCCAGCWRGSIALHAHPSSDHVRGQRAAPGRGDRARRPRPRRGAAEGRGGRRLPLRPALDARPRLHPAPRRARPRGLRHRRVGRRRRHDRPARRPLRLHPASQLRPLRLLHRRPADALRRPHEPRRHDVRRHRRASAG